MMKFTRQEIVKNISCFPLRINKRCSFLILLMTYYASGYGQLLSVKDQNIYIGPDVIMSIDGSVLNDGIIQNNGEIILTGGWDNNKQYLPGVGALVLIGDNQRINHNGSDIYELVIDGSGEMLFTSDANLLGRLYLENGLLTPGSGVKVMAKSSAVISDGYERSFINGVFYHQGSGKKIFPIGKNKNYHPVTLNIEGTPTLGFEVFEPNPKPYFSFELREVSRTKYWEQTLLSGEVGVGSLITLPLQWVNGDEVAINEVIIAGADLSGNYTPLETYDYTGFINSGSITSEFTGNLKLFALGLKAERPEERTIYIPNAFSPRQTLAQESGEDDRIKIYGKEISGDDFLFRIYNRWGILVYETTSFQEASTKGWNGVNQKTGKLESIGSYKFLLKGKYNSGRIIERSGTIHLIN